LRNQEEEVKVKISQLIPCILIFLIAGCTSTYVKKDFSSEEDFFRQINKNSGTADIIKMNNSVAEVKDITVSNDSLKWKISYDNSRADASPSVTRNLSLPVKDVKAVSIMHHGGSSLFYGTLAGITAGGVLGGLFTPVKTSSNSGEHIDYGTSIVIGAIAGILPGAILGLIMGDEDLYVFDDSFTRGSLKKYNSSHKFGLKLGRHSGFNYKNLPSEGADLAYVKITGYEAPGFMATLLYNQPFSRQLLISYELSYISERTDAWYSVHIPEDINQTSSMLRAFSDRSAERLNVLELSPVGRLNLFRSPISLYLIAGPRFDFIFPGESKAAAFFNNIKNQVNTQGIGVSAAYNKMVFGATFGGGFSTGNLLPVELLIEARFNYDITPRFKIHYDIPASAEFFHNVYIQSALVKDPGSMRMNYGSSELQLNIGAAIF
jgi:hypothetical protein